MLLEETKRRQAELNKILVQLSGAVIEENDAEKYLDRLATIYTGGFRHQYSSFYSLLLPIAEDEAHEGTNLEYLSNSLSVLYKKIEQSYTEGENKYNSIYMPFLKLRDHVNLEIARIQCMMMERDRLTDLERWIEDSKKDLSQAKESVKQANNNLEKSIHSSQEAIDKAENLQNEIITVLSIFSAVVLAFMGGMTFTGSTLESIAYSSIYKVSLVALICGLVMFNTICGLMYLVAKITGKNILSRCDTPHCSCACDGGVMKPCPLLTRIRRRLPYVFWFNFIFFSLILLIFIAWLIDLHNLAYAFRSWIFVLLE